MQNLPLTRRRGGPSSCSNFLLSSPCSVLGHGWGLGATESASDPLSLRSHPARISPQPWAAPPSHCGKEPAAPLQKPPLWWHTSWDSPAGSSWTVWGRAPQQSAFGGGGRPASARSSTVAPSHVRPSGTWCEARAAETLDFSLFCSNLNLSARDLLQLLASVSDRAAQTISARNLGPIEIN